MMSAERFAPRLHAKQERGPNGRRLCTWCGKEVPKGRRNWCSDDCVREYTVRRNPSHARAAIWKRDHGVCALCGLDTEALEEAIRYVHKLFDRLGYLGRYTEFIRALGKKAARWPDSLWDADHIVPVTEGGGGCGLDNLRTLCLACHHKETAWLHKRLRHRRAAAKATPLFAPGS